MKEVIDLKVKIIPNIIEPQSKKINNNIATFNNQSREIHVDPFEVSDSNSIEMLEEEEIKLDFKMNFFLDKLAELDSLDIDPTKMPYIRKMGKKYQYKKQNTRF